MKPEALQRIVIGGAGLMGASMAQAFAHFGFSVTLYDISEAALEKGKELIALNQKDWVELGLIGEENSERLQESLRFTTDRSVFRNCGLVVESIVEKLEVKQSFWREVSELAGTDCVFATNTSGLSITAIAEAVRGPERFAGMHWFNPSHIVPLVEVIQGEKTAQETADFLYDLALRIGKKPVRVKKDAKGFLANRLQLAVLREALHIVESGIGSPEDVDACMKYGLGLRYAGFGPFEVCDFGGLDTFYHIAEYLFPDLSDAKEPFGLLCDCFGQGEYGVKTQKGFYSYEDGKAEAAIARRDKLLARISAAAEKG